MKLLCTSVIVVMLGALLPSAAHAQWGYFGGLYGPRPFGGPYFGGYPYGGYGYGGYGYGGYGYGGWGNPGYGYPANGYPGYGYSGWTGYGLLSAPVVTPVVSYASTATPAPMLRPAVYPATAWRDPDPEPTATTRRAQINVSVPSADAQIWIDGVRMKQTGLERRFVTPVLDAGTDYEMEVRASWRDSAGASQSQTRRISVRAGGQQSLDFTVER